MRGWGHRRIAVWVGRPASTVRGWLRSFSACAEGITRCFKELSHRDGVDAASVWPGPASTGSGEAVSALMTYAAVLARRVGVGEVAWVEAGIAVSHAGLFTAGFWARASNTNWPFWRARGLGQTRGGVPPPAGTAPPTS